MPRVRWALLAVLSLGIAACSINPATGRMQFGLLEEEEEIRLGRELHKGVEREIPIYAEQFELTSAVAAVGNTLAKHSERPQLPWTFTVLDDATPNAFAGPGGFIYVTRGLLAFLNAEDELAAVLAHEVAHVTARHAAVTLRKQAHAQRSLQVFRVIDPELRHVGRFVEHSATLALLGHSRRAEREADDLAIRYLDAAGYRAAAFIDVLGVLARLEAVQGSDVPPWLRTHPGADQRRDEAKYILGVEAERLGFVDPQFIARLDGLRYGQDARDGYFLEQRFVHPRLGFALELPPRWRVLGHEGAQLIVEAPDKTARVHIAPLQPVSPEQAFADLFRDESIVGGQVWRGQVGGYTVVTSAFALKSGHGLVRGLIAFIDVDGTTLMAVGWGSDASWKGHADAVARTFASLGRLADPLLRNIEPMRVRVMTPSASQTLESFIRGREVAVSLSDLAILNHVDPSETLDAGRPVKIVVGHNPAFTARP